MNQKLIKLLAAISAGLCLVIVCEWFYAIYAQKKLLASVLEPDKHNSAAVQLPTLELTKQPETAYAELVSRPLFIPGRRPVAEANTNDTKPAVTTNQAFNWALNGVYTHKDGLYALLSRTSAKVAKDNFRKVTKDADVDGWKLTEIDSDKAIFSQGDQRKELPLRKPKPKTAPNAPNNPMAAPQIPGQPPQTNLPPDQQMMPPEAQMIPPEQQIPVPEQMPIPEPMPEEIEPIMEPEFIPDETTDPYFENNQNELYQ